MSYPTDNLVLDIRRRGDSEEDLHGFTSASPVDPDLGLSRLDTNNTTIFNPTQLTLDRLRSATSAADVEDDHVDVEKKSQKCKSSSAAHAGGTGQSPRSSNVYPSRAIPEPARYSFFSSATGLAAARKQYLTFYFLYVFLLILLMWILLPIYWGSLATSDRRTSNLKVFVVDLDGEAIGRDVSAAIQTDQQQDGDKTLGWDVVPQGTFSSKEDVGYSVIDEQAWAAIVVNENATNNLLTSLSSLSSTSDSGPAITAYYNQARNQLASSAYIVPLLTSFLSSTSLSITANLTATYMLANSLDAQKIQTFAQASSRLANSNEGSLTGYELINLRPFSAPVVEALAEIGMILICIFSFILTMANSALRPIVSNHLALRSYCLMRVLIPLLAYLPLSLSFALINLPFHVPFSSPTSPNQLILDPSDTALYKQGGRGFFLFWTLCYLLMAGLGLATEFAIGVLTIKFAPFFLVTIIITNVSVVEWPSELMPGIFKYGRAWPFYNASQAFRTIVFSTKSHLGTNIPVLVAWAVVSVITVGVSTYFIEGARRRRGEMDVAVH